MTRRESSQNIDNETAIVVSAVLPESTVHGDPLDEMVGLAETSGVRVVGRLTQRLERPHSACYLGKGKVGELASMVEDLEADTVLFDNELSPAQVRNLEKATGVKVLDRTELILDIFATRAQTHQARLAVELAQLEYSLPRLKRMWTHLSRMRMGVGMRGPGEKQLEVDRRLVERRIHDLKIELHKIEGRKQREVAGRSSCATVSLVGYTNAGKSTLMNALTSSDAFVEDKLFATLDTRTRQWQLPHWGPVLLSDTVGFIRDLPHRLIESFKATLEEARQTDLLLHVADASNPAMPDQVAAVYKVLAEIGIEEKDTLLVLNKIDRLASPMALEGILSRYRTAMPISAKSGEGLGAMATAISDALSRSFCEIDVVSTVDDGRLLAYLARHGEILSKRFDEERLTVHCRLPKRFLNGIEMNGAQVRLRQQNGAIGEREKACAKEQSVVLPRTDPDSLDDVA